LGVSPTTAGTVRKEMEQAGQLSKLDSSILALKLKPVIAEKAKEQQIRKPADFLPQKSAKQKPIYTREELAKIAGVSHDTIAKVFLTL